MIKNLTKIEIAQGLVATGVGLIGRKSFGNQNGLLLKNANAIHTFGVRFPIDLVFLDNNYKVLKTTENLKPLRFSPVVWRAKHVLEMPVGAVEKWQVKVGDTLDIER